MNSLQRTDIKHNFLKKVIYRMDYSGVLDGNLEKCIDELADIIKSHGFKNMEKIEPKRTEILYKLDLRLPLDDRIKLEEGKGDSLYIFFDKDKNSIMFSNSFFLLNILPNDGNYTFNKYLELIVRIIMTLKSINFINFERAGLRKVNICFSNTKEDIVKYFNEQAFNFYELQNSQDGYKQNKVQNNSFMTMMDYRINYLRSYLEGKLEDKDAYQIVLDIDVYIKNNLLLEEKFKEYKAVKNMLERQNDIVFDLFISSLSKEFINMLKSEHFNSTDILGVI